VSNEDSYFGGKASKLTGNTDKFNGVRSTTDSIDLLSIPYTECPKSRFTSVLLALQKNTISNQPTAECGNVELKKLYILLPTVADKKKKRK
jgi:hypothetical protein